MAFIFKTTKVIFLVSVLLFVLSRSLMFSLPDSSEVLPQLYIDPVQTPTDHKPFVIERNHGRYRYDIQPVFDYDIYGMVVSYHHSKDDLNFSDHSSWGDVINTLDLCVVWGGNIESGIYQKMTFSNGDWSCQPNWGRGMSRDEISKFRNNNLSNNHLLASNALVEQTLIKMRPGDQVHFKGQLVNYKLIGKDGDYRRSSTTRGDYGCEVIYVTSAELLKGAHPMWRVLYAISKIVMILSGVILLVQCLRLIEVIKEVFSPKKDP